MDNKHAQFHGNIEPALRVLSMPKDTNSAGDIFGGWIMSQVDIAGSIIASQQAKGRVVTVAVTDFLFKEPVFVGDVVSCYGEILKIGNTSITVQVEVCARREEFMENCIKVTEATLVYVAVDENRQPRQVPKK